MNTNTPLSTEISTSNRILEIPQQEGAASRDADKEDDCGSHMIQEDQRSYPTFSEILDMAGQMSYEDFSNWDVSEENGLPRITSEMIDEPWNESEEVTSSHF